MTPRSLLVLAPAAVLAAALAVPVTAGAVRPQAREMAKNAAVSVQNFTFTPSNAKIGLGGTVTWTFRDAVSHTATDTTGTLPAFSSGPKASGATYAFTFTAAGTYSYHCAIHPTMTGTVSVPMKFKPKKGGVGASYMVTWATSGAAGPFDVQIKRPGSGSFVPFMTGTTATSTVFHPDAGAGAYLFQAKPHAGAAAVFSPAKGIKVS